MARKASSKDSKKKMALAAILLMLAVVVVYQMAQGPNSAPKLASPQSGQASSKPGTPAALTTADATQRRSANDQPKDIEIQQLLADITPLDIAAMMAAKGSSGSGRNVFAYYVPPPPLPPKPEPPPPIALRFIQPQTAIAGTPKSFPLTVTGESFPEDAQIFLGGAAKPTKRLSPNQLTTEVAASDYRIVGTINVEVKSQSKPELFSNPVGFTAQPAPEPPARFLGIMGDLAVIEVNARGGKDFMRLRRGEKIEGIWRIDSISENGIEVTDVRYDIRKRLPL